MHARPVTPQRLAAELADAIAGRVGSPWLRAVVDGAPPAGAGALADALVGELRLRSRPVVRVSARDYLRPASLRLERGRRDPDVFYEDWLDLAGLAREVLAPLEPGGSGLVLPTLWDPLTDRATRAERVALPPGAVLLLDGALLLGRGLPLDLSVHLALSPAALTRRLDPALHWTLPAYSRYDREVEPGRVADCTVRLDDPNHPAVQVVGDGSPRSSG